MAWYMKISLFIIKIPAILSRYQPILQGCLYIVVKFMAVFSTLTP